MMMFWKKCERTFISGVKIVESIYVKTSELTKKLQEKNIVLEAQ